MTIDELASLKDFGMVVLGAGGDISEWVDGISGILKKDGIVDPDKETFSRAELLEGNVLGVKGRKDLVLIFNPGSNVHVGKLAIWRLQFGDISWIDDFIANYGSNYGNYGQSFSESVNQARVNTRATSKSLIEQHVPRVVE